MTCPVFPTESPHLVNEAVKSILGRIDTEQTAESEKTYVVGSTRDSSALGPLRQAIHDKRIIDAVRTRLQANWNGSTTFVRFDKQAASKGRVRLIDDAVEKPPLGSIILELSFDKSENEFSEFLNWFVPPTQDGHII